MKEQTCRKPSWLSWILFATALTFGCIACQSSVTPPATPQIFTSCSPPAAASLETAISRSRDDLLNPECQTQFDGYYRNLIRIGTRAPAAENKKQISDFLLWANGQGILTMVQAKEYYSRYFSTTFVSLPDQYNICSTCRDKPVILSNMEQEMRDKDLGLLKACGDKQDYYEARRQYDDTVLILEATCSACDERSGGGFF